MCAEASRSPFDLACTSRDIVDIERRARRSHISVCVSRGSSLERYPAFHADMKKLTRGRFCTLK